MENLIKIKKEASVIEKISETLWVVLVYSETIQKFIAVGEWATKEAAEVDLKNWR